MRLAETLSDIRECISTFPRRFGALPVPHDLSCHATLQKAKRKRCWRSGAWQLCAPALRMCDSERVHCAAPLTVHPGPAQLRVLHHHHHPRTDRTRLVPPPVLIGHALCSCAFCTLVFPSELAVERHISQCCFNPGVITDDWAERWGCAFCTGEAPPSLPCEHHPTPLLTLPPLLLLFTLRVSLLCSFSLPQPPEGPAFSALPESAATRAHLHSPGPHLPALDYLSLVRHFVMLL